MTAALANPPHRTDRVATVRSAPRREPPFDDELPRARLRLVGGRERELPFPEQAGPGPLGSSGREVLPEPGECARRLLIGLRESAAGRRPLHQVAALLSPAIYRGLGHDLERALQLGTKHWLNEAAVRSVRVSEPAEGIAEVAITLECGPRARAAALRMEARHGQWRCTRLQLG